MGDASGDNGNAVDFFLDRHVREGRGEAPAGAGQTTE